VLRNISRKSSVCLETGRWHYENFPWNKINVTELDKWTPNLKCIHASYAIMLLWQLWHSGDM
jgi:hypothetical protein